VGVSFTVSGDPTLNLGTNSREALLGKVTWNAGPQSPFTILFCPTSCTFTVTLSTCSSSWASCLPGGTGFLLPASLHTGLEEKQVSGGVRLRLGLLSRLQQAEAPPSCPPLPSSMECLCRPRPQEAPCPGDMEGLFCPSPQPVEVIRRQ
jgi:hypothetical protein